MKLVCRGCSRELDFPNHDIRPAPVERGDAQLFQLRHIATAEVQNFIFKCQDCRGIRATVAGQGASDWLRERLTSVKIFDDPTSNGQINMRVMKAAHDVLESTDSSDDEKLQFFRLLLLTAKKMVAVYRHLRSYAEAEDRLIQSESTRGGGTDERHIYLEHAQELLIEFDEFLVQIKSTLDYLIKVPRVIVGSRWSIQTFGDKGEKVIRALAQQIPREKKQIGKGVAELIVKKHQPWLQDVITARDRVNYLIGGEVAPEMFMVFAAPAREASSILQIHRPMWSAEQTVREFMAVVWGNLLRLVEDFVISFLVFRLQEGWALYHGEVERGSARSPWRVATIEERDRVVARPGWQRLNFED